MPQEAPGGPRKPQEAPEAAGAAKSGKEAPGGPQEAPGAASYSGFSHLTPLKCDTLARAMLSSVKSNVFLKVDHAFD